MNSFSISGNLARGSNLLSLVIGNLLDIPNFFLRFVIAGNIMRYGYFLYKMQGAMPMSVRCVFDLYGKLISKYIGNPNHYGKTHVGLGNGSLTEVNFYSARGRVVILVSIFLNIIADVNIGFRTRFSQEGMIYNPNYGVFFATKGIIATLKKYAVKCTSKLRQNAMRVMRLRGNMTVISNHLYVTFAELIAICSTGYLTSCVLLEQVKSGYLVRSVCNGLVEFFYRTRAICKANYDAKFEIRGASGDTGIRPFQVTGLMGVLVGTYFNLKANLLNDKGDWFMKICGTLSPIVRAFVFAVPVRNQQFMTNKRWFRNGD